MREYNPKCRISGVGDERIQVGGGKKSLIFKKRIEMASQMTKFSVLSLNSQWVQ